MTTKKQIRDLLKPVMVNNPDIVISGQLAFLTPIRHVISGIEFQRGLTKDFCHVTPFTTETCGRLNLPFVNFLNRIRFDGRDSLFWDKPDIVWKFQNRLATEIVPQLRILTDINAYVKNRYHSIEHKHDHPLRFLISLPAIIASGDLDFATLIYREVFEHMDWVRVEAFPMYRENIDWYRGFKVLLEPLLNRDIPKLVEILRDFERESISKSGYEKYWENAPFPLEEFL